MTVGAAYGVSADGSIIVGVNAVEQFSAWQNETAVVWDSGEPGGGVRTLASYLAEHGVDLPDGWTLRSAHGISADGTVIAGMARDAEGLPRGFVAVIPGTGSAAALTVGGATVGLRRRRAVHQPRG